MNINRSALTCNVPWTEERKAKIAASKIGRKMPPVSALERRARSERMKGHEVSAETRAKIGAANRGRRRTEEHKRKAARPGSLNGQWGRFGADHPAAKGAVEQIDPESGVVLKVWPSVTDAARGLGCDSSFLSKAARGVKPLAVGYKWRRIED